MAPLLYLVHRLPYPPDKGDKIRSFNILSYLLERFDVFLGCFVDDENDRQYVDKLRAMCAEVYVEEINPSLARLRSLPSLLTGESLSVRYYRSRGMSRWVSEQTRRPDMKAAIAFSSPMGQFISGPEYEHLTRVMDFVDVDSDKWRQYAENKRGFVSWVYRREALSLGRFERAIAEEFDASTFVSPEETELFSQTNPGVREKARSLPNGVDSEFFDPSRDYSNPYLTDTPRIVFTGLMSYWPNVDAVCWFAESIFPRVRSANPRAEFWIVGGSPTRVVQDLAEMEGVIVTGRVPDIRPYLAHAQAVVAPLRIARGVQNKVLEALSMCKAVICSPEAAAGIKPDPDSGVMIADGESEFSREVIEHLDSTTPCVHQGSRDFVIREYGWATNLALLDDLIGSGTGEG